MKKTAENRYPYSATLFRFCKEALEIRYDGNVKVIDQDVGAILGYDPADCSHWKKGKKNIRALGTLKSIADHLNVDERLLIDIAAGKVDLDEAVFEFRGYGKFYIEGHSLEELKKEYFRNPERWQQNGKLNTFEDLFNINRKALEGLVSTIVASGNFNEAPLYLPEVAAAIGNLSIKPLPEVTGEGEIAGGGPTVERRASEDGSAVIYYKGTAMRPYMRFLVAKEIFMHLVESQHELASQLNEVPSEARLIEANIFAGLLLIPQGILASEVESIDSSLDIVGQLAETFWVSKALMNQRLRDFMSQPSLGAN